MSVDTRLSSFGRARVARLGAERAAARESDTEAVREVVLEVLRSRTRSRRMRPVRSPLSTSGSTTESSSALSRIGLNSGRDGEQVTTLTSDVDDLADELVADVLKALD